MMFSIYGMRTPMPDPFEAERQARTFEYLKAKINAERLNPAPDYDNERSIKILEEVAVSNTSVYQRQELVKMLSLSDGEE
jgi:hypothetical protein